MASEACNLLIFRQRIGYNCHGFSTNDIGLTSVRKNIFSYPYCLVNLSLKITTSASSTFSFSGGRRSGAALQIQTTYLPHELHISIHHFRKAFILSYTPKSEGCALMASPYRGKSDGGRLGFLTPDTQTTYRLY
jgi:hypothetical protein